MKFVCFKKSISNMKGRSCTSQSDVKETSEAFPSVSFLLADLVKDIPNISTKDIPNISIKDNPNIKYLN